MILLMTAKSWPYAPLPCSSPLFSPSPSMLNMSFAEILTISQTRLLVQHFDKTTVAKRLAGATVSMAFKWSNAAPSSGRRHTSSTALAILHPPDGGSPQAR
ncbi:unnamed protein product [Ectocarpus sp. 12 AP-2014]